MSGQMDQIVMQTNDENMNIDNVDAAMVTITDQDLTEVSKNIGLKWNALGRKFGYNDEQLENFGANQPGLPGMCTRMLDCWKEKYGNEVSIKVLAESLCSIKRKDMAEKIGKETEVTDIIIEYISENIGLNWSNLARKLGFSKAETNEFENPLNKAYREIAITMLNEWVQKENEAATVHELSAKLESESVGRKDIADEIGKSTDKVSKDIIEYVARRIGKSWRQLGRKLEYTEENLDNYANTGSKTLEESCWKMLKAWQKENGEEATKEKLIECLLAIERKDLTERIGAPVDLR